MPLSPSEQARLAFLESRYGPTPAPLPERDGLFTRLGKGLANTPSNIIEGLMGAGTGAVNLFASPENQTTPADLPNFFDIPPPQNWKESGVDLGVGLAELGAQIAIPEAAAAHGLQLAGLGAKAARIGSAGIGWGLSGLEHGGGEAALQGATGATFAATEFLPRKARIPLALLGGALGYAEGAQRSPLEGGIMAGVNTLLPFAHGQTHLRLPEITSSATQTAEEAAFGQMTAAQQHAQVQAITNPTDYGERPAVSGVFGVEGQVGTKVPGWEQGPIPVARHGEALLPPGEQVPLVTPYDFNRPPSPTQHGSALLPSIEAPGVKSYGWADVPERTGSSEVSTALPNVPEEAPPVPTVEPPPVATLQTEAATPHPQNSLSVGLQSKLADAPGWTAPGAPLGPSFTRDAFAFGKTFTSKKDVERAFAGARKLEREGMKMLETGSENDLMAAQELINKAQYLREAAEYAHGEPGKLDLFRKHVDPNYEPPVPGDTYKEATKPRPPEPVEPAAVATLQNSPTPSESHSFQTVRFQENGKWVEGKIQGREDGVVTVLVDDPIRGERVARVQEAETKPVALASEQTLPVESKGTRPFADIPNAKTIKSSSEGDFDSLETLLRSKDAPRDASRYANEPYIIGEDGSHINLNDIEDPAASFNRPDATLHKVSTDLEKVGGLVLKDMLTRVLRASGQRDIPLAFFSDWSSKTKGSANPAGGFIRILTETVEDALKNWPVMGERQRAEAILGLTKLLGHEISHLAVAAGNQLKLEVNGRPLSEAFHTEVMKLPLITRQFIAGEIATSLGKGSDVVSNYLAGDVETVWKHYVRNNPKMMREDAMQYAAEEFFVELASIELHKRIEVKGLTGVMRAALDKLKEVMVGVLHYFRGNKSNIAALQNLQEMARTTLDHFKGLNETGMAEAFPASSFWEKRAMKSQEDFRAFREMNPPTSAFREPTDPLDWITFAARDMASGHPPMPPTSSGFLKNEMMLLGLRTLGGALAGGALAPTFSKEQLTAAEGALLGGLMGAFGPAFARKIMHADLVADGVAALKAGKGNPVKSLTALLEGKTLKELGGEALFTTRQGTSAFVRTLERSLGINFDPKLRGVLENSRGLAAAQFGQVLSAMRNAKDFDASPGVQLATLQFLEGKMSAPVFVRTLTTTDELAYGTLITTARAGIDNLQTMFASGLKDGVFKNVVQSSVGSYLGKFYKAYTEGKFNMDAFADAKADLQKAFPAYSDEVADSILYQHMREVKANRTVFGRLGVGGQQLDPTLWKRKLATESEIEAQQHIVDGMTSTDPDYSAAKSKLDWMNAHPITDGWAAWLDEVRDPKERALRTFQKVYSSSISGKTFDLLSTSTDSLGLKFAYTAEELSLLHQSNAARLAMLTPAHPDFATLQKEMSELKYYVPLPSGTQYGKLSGKMVSRFVRDEIATDTSPFKWMEQPVFRAISEFNNAIKIGRTALNPITVIRNYIQMPMFGLIAKTNMGDLTEAWKHIRAHSNVHRIMQEKGITTVDMALSEMTDGPGRLFSGFFDSDAATRMAARGFDTAMEIYRAPDMVLRAGTFISAVKREAGGDLARGLADPAIVEKATAFTNRYTMNYHAVPKIIKVGRQLPFVSLFLSYTAEITRILKNLVQDAVSPTMDSGGRMHALGVLGGMAAIPALMVTASEAALSAKDRKEWDKVKALSPNYSKLRFRIPTSRDAKGNFHYFDITNLLPADSYSMMVRGIAQGDFVGAASVNPVLNVENTPLLNIATEQISGKDTHTGRTIAGLDRVRAILQETLPPITPAIGYEAQRIGNAFTPNDRGELGLTNLRSGRSVMPSDIILNYLTGMKFANVNPDTIQRGYMAEAKQQIAEQQQLLRQTTMTDQKQAVKDAATARFSSAVKQIVFQMHEKLGLEAPPP